MEDYQRRLARLLAESGALLFKQGLTLKDGRPTPYFVNLGLFRSGRLAIGLGECFADWLAASPLAGQVDLLLGPSYKGSAIAQAAAIALWQRHGIDVAFDYDRKEKKTHGEASGKGAAFVTGALKDGARTLIIDDVGTSMATKVELLEKIGAAGIKAKVLGVALAVDREQTQAVYDENGRVRLGERGADALAAFSEKTGLAVWPLLTIRQALAALLEDGLPVMVDGEPRPMDAELKARVDEYLAVYGRGD